MKNKIKYDKLEIKEEKEENTVAIDKTRLVEISIGFEKQYLTDKKSHRCIERRSDGAFYNKALYLPSMFDWVLGKDEDDVFCLVPLKKNKSEEE